MMLVVTLTDGVGGLRSVRLGGLFVGGGVEAGQLALHCGQQLGPGLLEFLHAFGFELGSDLGVGHVELFEVCPHT